jgi:hypothetical protein
VTNVTDDPRSFFAVKTSSAPEVTPMAVGPSSIKLSEPTKVDISVYRGDSGSFRITVSEDVVGTPIDISAATWDADIRIKAIDPLTISNFEIVPVSGDTSSVDVVLSPENSELLSATCVYDIEMTLGGEVKTLIYGTITVTQDVSRP